MNPQIEAGFDGPLNPGSGKRVIGNRNDFAFPCSLRDFFEVDDFKQRVARRFYPNQGSVRLDCACEQAGIGEIDVGEVEICRPTPYFLEEPERAAVKI